ncbi:MAG TPA: L-threonylcarbamoyladenylate synthase [Opitutaceae bacterium]|nr:L-threonylcarbamoyladenylate synthase [Opitutaceae bacterium]
MTHSAKVYRGTPENLRRLARILRRGGLVAVPTETVYGLAANALDARACRQIFRAKRRPADDPLIVHVADLRMLARIAVPNEAVARLARAFWPGPLTLVLPRQPVIPDVVTAGLPSVAVRMPAHPLLRRLLRLSRLPLAAPSANLFGYVSPTTAAHVRDGLGSAIAHILDGGPCRHGLESTIVDVRDPRRPVLLRPGVITAGQLARVLGVPVRAGPRRPSPGISPPAPGLLARHYSPLRPMRTHRRITAAMVARARSDEAWICFRRPAWAGVAKNVFWLSGRGDVGEAGRRLFALLRRLDRGSWTRLHAELAPASGPGLAINDRLRRAAAK